MLLKRRLDLPAAPSVAARPTVGLRPARAESGSHARPPEPGIAVVAPLTGVFYTSSSPSSPPFIEVGDAIQAGQVVCIVEAMKVFNEIKSEVAGTVSAFVAQNGQLVQKGDALIRVKSQ